jgi:hypothetical protein
MILQNIKMSNMVISPNKVYEIKLEDGYSFEEKNEAIVIFNEQNGYGAISITSYQIPAEYEFDKEKELKDFAVSINEKVNSQTLHVTINGHASSEFITNGEYWKIWTFFKNNYAVFGSYNCLENERGYEIGNINRIMQSLKILK